MFLSQSQYMVANEIKFLLILTYFRKLTFVLRVGNTLECGLKFKTAKNIAVFVVLRKYLFK